MVRIPFQQRVQAAAASSQRRAASRLSARANQSAAVAGSAALVAPTTTISSTVRQLSCRIVVPLRNRPDVSLTLASIAPPAALRDFTLQEVLHRRRFAAPHHDEHAGDPLEAVGLGEVQGGLPRWHRRR